MRTKSLKILVLISLGISSTQVFASGGSTAANITDSKQVLLNGTTVDNSCTPVGGPYTNCNTTYMTSTEDASTPIVRKGSTTIAAAATSSGSISLSSASYSSSFQQPATNATYFNSTYSFPKRESSKTAVFFTYESSTANASDSLIYLSRTESGGNLNSITFTRNSTTGTISIQYWVVYFPKGVNVTYGTFSMASSYTGTTNGSCPSTPKAYSCQASTLSITSSTSTFSKARSFLTFGWTTDGATLNSQTMIRGSISADNTLTFTRDSSSTTTTITGSFQVVSFYRGSAQHGYVTIANPATTGSATITAIDTARTMLLSSCSYSTAGSLADKAIYASITSSTNIGFTRLGATGTLYCEWTAFQFPVLDTSKAPSINTGDSGTVNAVRTGLVTVADASFAQDTTFTSPTPPFRQSSIVIPVNLFAYNESTSDSSLNRTLVRFAVGSNTVAFDTFRASRGDNTKATKTQYNLITFGAPGRVMLIE